MFVAVSVTRDGLSNNQSEVAIARPFPSPHCCFRTRLSREKPADKE
jgi:hypothetical protein